MENKWGSQFASDGNVGASRMTDNFYRSQNVSYPWLMTVLPHTIEISSIRISNRKDCCGEGKKHIEIRAGKTKLRKNHVGIIKQNTHCESFLGQEEDMESYTIYCEYPIPSLVFTIQIIDPGFHTLHVDEVEWFSAGMSI